MSTHENAPSNPDPLPPDSSSGQGSQEPPKNELPRWATRQAAATPFSDARMAAFIGPRWETKYRAKLTPFFEDPSFTASWNWAAALGYPFWFLYRKLYMTFATFFAVSMVALVVLTGDVDKTALLNPESPEAKQFSMMTLAIGLSLTIAAGGTGNWFLFRRARAASMVVSMQQVPEDVAITRLQRFGGVSLPSVLVVLVVFTIAAMYVSSAGAP